jgi:hypothetical protein
MDVLASIRAGNREIECGLVTTRRESAAVFAQRFRVYQRRGYYRPGLRQDRDEYDKAARYFLALLGDGAGGAWLLGSARVIFGEARAGFSFPAERAFEFELPAAIRGSAAAERVEVTRVAAEAARGIVIGGLLTPLGLIQAIAAHTQPLGVHAGLAVIKRRFLRALQALGVRLHEIQPARLVYPSGGPVSGYYHQHPDPVVPVYWLVDEIAPTVERAIAAYLSRHTSPLRTALAPSIAEMSDVGLATEAPAVEVTESESAHGVAVPPAPQDRSPANGGIHVSRLGG